jgi:hypothetical protein
MDAGLVSHQTSDAALDLSPCEAARRVRVPRWTAPAFLLFAVALIPWTVWLALSLPHRYVTENYHLTWVGFDGALTVVLLGVMWLAWRRSTYIEPMSAVAGTMLVVDAWFDVTSARPGRDVAIAIATAILVELPISALCWWVAQNAELVRRRQGAWLARRQLQPAAAGAGPVIPSVDELAERRQEVGRNHADTGGSFPIGRADAHPDGVVA